MADLIITEKWYDNRKSNSTEKSHQIILAAAKLIREEIRAMPYNKETYPSLDEFDLERCEDHLCPGLKLLMSSIVTDPLKRIGLGHCITQCARPRSVISPIPFGVGTEFHHVFGSEWAVNQLHSLSSRIPCPSAIRW
jgi:hypothetical protein